MPKQRAPYGPIDKPSDTQEMTMTTFANAYRDLTCALAAAAISAVLGLSFLSSTSVPPGAHSPATHAAVQQSQYAWFGQPEPAVLVD